MKKIDFHRATTLLVVVCLLSSCKTGMAPNASGTVQTPANIPPLGAVEDTRVYARQECLLGNDSPQPARQDFAPLLGILAPILIGKAIGGIASAFRKAGTDEVVRKIAASPMYLYERTGDTPAGLRLHKSLGCVILVHGMFDPKLEEAAPGAEPPPVYSETGIFDTNNADQDVKRLKRLNDNKIPVTKVHMLTELEVSRSQDRTALLYQAKFLWVKQFLGSRSIPGRGLVVNVNLIGAGAKPEEPAISGALINFGEINEAALIGPKGLKGVMSDWAGGIGIGKESKDAFAALSSNQKVLNYMPVTLKAGFAETAKGNAIAKFIGEVLEAGKTDLTKLANDQISPTEREKTDAKEETDNETLTVREETAFAAHLKAKADREKEVAATPPASGQRLAQLDFEIARTERLWCNSLKAFKAAMQITPPGRTLPPSTSCAL